MALVRAVAMASQSRFGRRLQAPDRYRPEEYASDDATDEDESVDMASSYTSESDNSLEGFIVDEEESEEDEQDDLDAAAPYIAFIHHLCDGAPAADIVGLVEAVEAGQARTDAFRGLLAAAAAALNAQ